MISSSNSQLLFNEEFNQDINEKLTLVKNTAEPNLKEKQAKDVCYLLASKISKSLEKNNISEIQEIMAERGRLRQDLAAYELPSIDKQDKKSTDNYSPNTNFYYEAIKNQCLLDKSVSPSVAEGIFKFYLHYIEKFVETNENQSVVEIANNLADKDTKETNENKGVQEKSLLLNEQINSFILDDYVDCYRHTLQILKSERKQEEFQDTKDLFWEMPTVVSEVINLPYDYTYYHVDERKEENLSPSYLKQKQKNLFIISFMLATFKGVLVETSIDCTSTKKDSEEDENSFLTFFRQKISASKFLSLEKYFELMKARCPQLYLESVIQITLINLLNGEQENKDTGNQTGLSKKVIKNSLIMLLKASEYLSTYRRFVRRNSDIKLINKYSESIRSFVTLLVIALFGNLYSSGVKQILQFIELEPKHLETSNLESVFLSLSFPVISEYNSLPIIIITNKVKSMVEHKSKLFSADDLLEFTELEKEIISSIN